MVYPQVRQAMEHVYKGIDLNFGHTLVRGGGKGTPEHLHGLVDFCEDNVMPNHTVLELGCLEGASTKVFSHFASRVITVDINFNRVDKSSIGENVEFIQCSSLTVSEILEVKQIKYDVLYIDTVHTEGHCTKELNSLYKYCRSFPKIIGGHDYHFSGIKKAVESFFNRAPNKVYSDYSWIYHDERNDND